MTPIAAARQFEALWIAQMLRSARESSREDSSLDTAADLAGQQFAQVMADAGGFGLADLVARGLGRDAAGRPGGETVHGDFRRR